eukprot:Gb_07811 [translate_table: standard]
MIPLRLGSKKFEFGRSDPYSCVLLFNEVQKAWKVAFTLQADLKTESVLLAEKLRIEKDQNTKVKELEQNIYDAQVVKDREKAGVPVKLASAIVVDAKMHRARDEKPDASAITPKLEEELSKPGSYERNGCYACVPCVNFVHTLSTLKITRVAIYKVERFLVKAPIGRSRSSNRGSNPGRSPICHDSNVRNDLTLNHIQVFRGINPLLPFFFVHTPAGELQQQIQAWLAENFDSLLVIGGDAIGGVVGQLELLSTSIMDDVALLTKEGLGRGGTKFTMQSDISPAKDAPDLLDRSATTIGGVVATQGVGRGQGKGAGLGE